ncbi:MAG: transposase, partial [Verrucomicrobiota bacterium]
MRLARRKIGAEEGAATYHCLSRVVDQRFIFGTEEKERFVQLLREYEQFCGVEVLTYCIMSNHFHILVEVPKMADTPLPLEEVLQRLAGLSGAAITAGQARQRLKMFAAAHDEAGAEAYLDGFRQRMGDVSEFIKLLKQRFTQWYNRRNGRKGTLWEDRFKSVLVEGKGDALMTLAAYIDLNPVRAGLVAEPGQYRWSGYGEALAGNRRAKEGIRTLYGRGVHSPEASLTESMEGYRKRVFTQGEEGCEGTDATGAPLRKGIAREAVMEVLAAKGRLGWGDYVRCRVRYFSDGVAVGSREFVEAM